MLHSASAQEHARIAREVKAALRPDLGFSIHAAKQDMPGQNLAEQRAALVCLRLAAAAGRLMDEREEPRPSLSARSPERFLPSLHFAAS